MSNNPFSSPAQFDSAGQVPASLPGMATVLTILGLLAGAWNLLAGCCGTAVFSLLGILSKNEAFQQALEKQDPEAAAQLKDVAGQVANPVMIAMVLLAGAMGAAVVLGAIGTLSRKEWGRRLFTISSLVAAVLGAVGLAYQFLSGQLNPANNPGLANVPADQQQQAYAIAVGSVVFGVLLSLAFIGLYLWIWRYFSAEERRSYFT